MNVIRSAWKLMLVLLLLFSLSINVAMFVGGTIYQMASSAFGAATGVRTVAALHADEIVEIGSDLANERKVSRELRGDVADISDNLVSERKLTRKLRGEVTDITGSLATEKAVRRKLKNEVADLAGDLAAERLVSMKVRSQLAEVGGGIVTFRGKKMARKQAVEFTADGISKRAIKTARRSISSMAAEALPYLGTAVIVGVTVLELKDLCDTIKDMNELKLSFNPELRLSEDETKVCSLRVPTKEEIWKIAKTSPKKAWIAAKDATPTLQEIKNYPFLDIEWYGVLNLTEESVASVWSAIKGGAETALDATTETAGGLLNKATEYRTEEENQENE